MSFFASAWSVLQRAGAVFAKPVALPGDSVEDTPNDTSAASAPATATGNNSDGTRSPKAAQRSVSSQAVKAPAKAPPALSFDAEALLGKTAAVWSRPLSQSSVAIDLPRLATMMTIRVNGVIVACPSKGIAPEGPPADAPVFVILYTLAKVLDGDKLAAKIDETLPLAVPSLCVPKTAATQAVAGSAAGSLRVYLEKEVGESSRTVAVLRGCTQGAIAPSVGTLYALAMPNAFLDAGLWTIDVDVIDSGGDPETVITHHKRQRGQPLPGTEQPKYEFEWSLALHPSPDFRTLARAVLAVEDIVDNTPRGSDTVDFLLNIRRELRAAF